MSVLLHRDQHFIERESKLYILALGLAPQQGEGKKYYDPLPRTQLLQIIPGHKVFIYCNYPAKNPPKYHRVLCGGRD